MNLNEKVDKVCLFKNIKLNSLLFADDLSILSSSIDQQKKGLKVLEQYASKWRMVVNVDKTKHMVIGGRSNFPNSNISYKGIPIEEVEDFQYLGVPLCTNGNWSKWVNDVSSKAKSVTNQMASVLACKQIPASIRSCIWKTSVHPILEYG